MSKWDQLAPILSGIQAARDKAWQAGIGVPMETEAAWYLGLGLQELGDELNHLAGALEDLLNNV